MLKARQISTSPCFEGYVPYFLLSCYSVFFNNKELSVAGPEGMKCANCDAGIVLLNNGRILHGAITINEVPPF